MNVTPANVIRFPLAPAATLRAAQLRPAVAPDAADPAGNVVAFPSTDENSPLTAKAHEYGLWSAAQRIVGRVADQLEQTPLL